jgi:hypothetical protein
MQGTCNFELGLQGSVKAGREHGHAVFVAFTLAIGELILSEISVLDAQAHALHEAQAGALEQACHEKFGSGKVAENGFDFGTGENDRQASGTFRPFDAFDHGQSDVQHIAIEEEEGIEGDVLGGGGDVAYSSKMGEVGADFGNAEVLGVSFAMKSDIASDGGEVGLLPVDTVVFEAQDVPDFLVKIPE